MLDPPTGGWNEPGFRALLQFTVDRCQREQRSLALIFARLGKPKVEQETWTRADADLVCAEVAQELSRAFDSTIGRIAEDEFLIAVTDQEPPQLARTIETVATHLRAHPELRLRQVQPELGFYVASHAEMTDVDTLIARAQSSVGVSSLF